jgi:5-methylcytosine-specific restriction endonuclease McrA
MALRHKNNTSEFKRQRLKVLARDQRVCQYCGAEDANHVDHVIAKVDGGGDEMSNLLTSCAPCNLKKGRKSLALFLGSTPAPTVSPDLLSPVTVSSSLPGPFEGQPRPSWN